MNYKVYINAINGWPVGDWGIWAYEGWKARGTDIIFFEDIMEVPANPYNIVVADITTTNKQFERLGLAPKLALNVPEEIEKFCGRSILRTNMSLIRNNPGTVAYPFFIKGNGLAKVFVPGVVKDSDYLDMHFHDVEDNEPILVSEVVNFVSEYRVYVMKGEILGVKHYIGDFFTYPDGNVIKEAIKAYITAPAGYVMDFGVTTDGRTLLVECNDGWSIGNYGLSGGQYVSLLAARWVEMMTERAKSINV
jgi:ATP-grasp domain-containing protein